MKTKTEVMTTTVVTRKRWNKATLNPKTSTETSDKEGDDDFDKELESDIYNVDVDADAAAEVLVSTMALVTVIMMTQIKLVVKHFKNYPSDMEHSDTI